MTRLDLNLLPALAALLEHCNVTRAAEQLNLSQPAMSAALAKLRRHFGDDLLVRSGRSYVLTPLAQDLLPLVDDALDRFDGISSIAHVFDPSQSRREFVLAASDYAASLIAAPLRRILSEEASGVTVNIVPTALNVDVESEPGRWDLVIGPVGYEIPGRRRHVFRDSFVAVVDETHPLLTQDSVSLQELAALPQAIGTFGPGIRTPADELWLSLGLQRTVVAQVSGYLALPLLVSDTDLLAMVPRMLAYRLAEGCGLGIIEIPTNREAPLVEAMFWHPKRDQDPTNQWLRDVVQRACSQVHDVLDTVPEVAIRMATEK